MNTFRCVHCNKENAVKRNHANKFCNNSCQADYQFSSITIPKFKQGEISNRRTLHRILKHTQGYKCIGCNNEGTHNSIFGTLLALQLDHIDGNASNNMPENLRLLCPNCHSQTDTFVSKNKGKGRQARGLKR
jgi:5-methylcytosine-specific restriction endonuclease McrA